MNCSIIGVAEARLSGGQLGCGQSGGGKRGFGVQGGLPILVFQSFGV
jgi:hypothetical protein